MNYLQTSYERIVNRQKNRMKCEPLWLKFRPVQSCFLIIFALS